MGQLSLTTTVEKKKDEVWKGFTQELFNQLNPPFPKATLLRYDGNKTGDYVIIELDFVLFKTKWVSVITANAEKTDENYFIDEGEKLPFFLSTWKHKHRIVAYGDKTNIIDEITYKSPFGILIYPLLYAQFAMRKPIYRRVFSI